MKFPQIAQIYMLNGDALNFFVNLENVFGNCGNSGDINQLESFQRFEIFDEKFLKKIAFQFCGIFDAKRSQFAALFEGIQLNIYHWTINQLKLTQFGGIFE